MVRTWFDVGMEVQDIRRKRLRELVDERSAGNITAFADKVKKSSSQINDMLAARKPFGEKVARDLERRCRKPEGWLDHEHDAAATQDLPSDLDYELLRSAIIVTERAIAARRVMVTPEARAALTLGTYDILREDQDQERAGRMVARMLQAIGGATITT